MSRINLLPWRAELRKQQQKDFLMAIGLGVSLTVLVLLLVHTNIAARISHQNQRNDFLNREILVLDAKIKEIHELETKKKRLLARMDVIQELQASRPEIVHVFEQISRTTPDGVYLTDLLQADKSLTVNGYAQSNARVSAYMRNLETSHWLKDPVLTIIEAKNENKDKEAKKAGSKFTLQIKLASDKPAEKAKPKGAS